MLKEDKILHWGDGVYREIIDQYTYVRKKENSQREEANKIIDTLVLDWWDCIVEM